MSLWLAITDAPWCTLCTPLYMSQVFRVNTFRVGILMGFTYILLESYPPASSHLRMSVIRYIQPLLYMECTSSLSEPMIHWPSERRIVSFLYTGDCSITCVSMFGGKSGCRVWYSVWQLCVNYGDALWILVFKLDIASFYLLCAASAFFLDRSVTFVLGFM